MSDKVALPGDGDEPAEKLSQARKNAPAARKRVEEDPVKRVADEKQTADPDKMGEAMKEQQDKEKKGPFSPAQHDDDGWNDTPVQMRGE